MQVRDVMPGAGATLLGSVWGGSYDNEYTGARQAVIWRLVADVCDKLYPRCKMFDHVS